MYNLYLVIIYYALWLEACKCLRKPFKIGFYVSEHEIYGLMGKFDPENLLIYQTVKYFISLILNKLK